MSRMVGTVSRGVCEVSDGYLSKVTEHTALDKNSGIPLDTLVSMNMWGLQPSIFEALEKGFVEFLQNNDVFEYIQDDTGKVSIIIRDVGTILK